MIYILDCGCELQDFELSETTAHKFYCPHHPGSNVIARISKCKKCGVDIKNGPRGGVSVKCEQCRKADKPTRKLPPRKVTLHFECGCTIDRQKAVRRSIDGTTKLACEKHRSQVEYRVTTCRDCGNEFRFYTGSMPPRHCPDCKAGKQPDLKKTYQNPRLMASIDRADCAYRDECLSEAWGDNNEFLPCYGCEKYLPDAIKPLQVSRHDPYEWAYVEAV